MNIYNPIDELKNTIQIGNGFGVYNNRFIDIDKIRNGTPQSIFNENIELFLHFSHFYNLLSTIFEFTNLPSHFTSIFLLRILVEYGTAVIAKKDDNYYISPYFYKTAKLNESGEPVEITLNTFSLFGIGEIYNSNKNVVVRKNGEKENFSIIKFSPLGYSVLPAIYYFALKMNEAQILIDNNVFALQQPILFSGSSNHKTDLLNLYQKFFNKVRAFFMLKADNVINNEISVIDTKAKNYLEDFRNHKKSIEQEFFNFFGINYTPFEKKERLITDEVNSNNEYLELTKSIYYRTLKESIEILNEELGLDIQIKSFYTDKEKEGDIID